MKHTFFLIVCAALAGCGQIHSQRCDTTERVLTDEEPLPDLDVSVANLFADAAGRRVVLAQVLDGAGNMSGTEALEVGVGREEGSAIWTDVEVVEESSPYFGFGDLEPNILVICEGGLVVPASLEVAQAEGDDSMRSEAELLATPSELAADTFEVLGAPADYTGNWAPMRSAWAQFADGELSGLQLQEAGNRIVRDWR